MSAASVPSGLLDSWHQALASLGLTGREARRAADELLQRWQQPHRHYHDVTHLQAMLSALDLLANGDGARPEAVLATWFHDAVYDAQPGTDEQASAVVAQQVLTELGAPTTVVAEVARLVLLTADHRVEPGDEAGAMLLDADLSVLAAAPQDYQRYTEGVRAEYSHLDDATFQDGRRAVLQSFVQRQHLFATARGRQLWEEAARANLQRELTLLSQSDT